MSCTDETALVVDAVENPDEELYLSRGQEVFTAVDNHHMLRQVFGDLLNSSKLSDFTLQVKNEKFCLHKVILASGSKYFNNFFMAAKDHESTFTSLDFEPVLVRYCLEFIYKGTVSVPCEIATDLAHVADALGMTLLYAECLRSLYKNVSIVSENCLEIWAAGTILHDAELCASAKAIALSSFVGLPQNKGFSSLPFDCLLELLSHPDLVTQSPDERLMAALIWTKGDAQHRGKQLSVLLNALPLAGMGFWTLKQALFDPVVVSSPQAQQILSEAAEVSAKKCETEKQEKKQDIECLVIMGSQNHDGGQWHDASDEVMILPLSLKIPCFKLTRLPATVPRNGFIACCSDDGFIYTTGLGKSHNEAWRYDIKNNRWESSGKLQRGRQRHCMAAVNGQIFVFGGSEAGAYNKMVHDVEMLMPGTSTWGVVGQLPGSYCYNTTCCVSGEDVIIYGVQDDNDIIQLQVFSGQSLCVSHSVSLASGGMCYVNGVCVLGEYVIMCDASNTCVCALKHLYDNISDSVTLLADFKIPNEDCIMTVSADNDSVILVGGKPRKGSGNFVYKAQISQMTGRNNGNSSINDQCNEMGWLPIDTDLNIKRCFVRSGACTVMSLPAKNCLTSDNHEIMVVIS